MKNRKEDISNYLGRAIFIALFFLLLAAFSDRAVEQSKDAVQYELVSEWHAKSAQAIGTDDVQLPSFQKNLVSSVDKMNLKVFNATFKRSADDRRIAQQFISFHQTELVIKPFAMCRFYYHLFV